MSDETGQALLEEVRLLRGEIDSLRADLAARRASGPESPAAAKVRVEPYTLKEFCAIIRRGRVWVSTRCKDGVIQTLPGRGYRIPVSEAKRWTEAQK